MQRPPKMVNFQIFSEIFLIISFLSAGTWGDSWSKLNVLCSAHLAVFSFSLHGRRWQSPRDRTRRQDRLHLEGKEFHPNLGNSLFHSTGLRLQVARIPRMTGVHTKRFDKSRTTITDICGYGVHCISYIGELDSQLISVGRNF